MAPVPLLPREIDPVGALHPQLRREVVALKNVVKPVRPVLPQPCLLVLIPEERVAVAEILQPSVHAGDVRQIPLRRLARRVGGAIVHRDYFVGELKLHSDEIDPARGIKGKVIESFANAIPVISTTIGLQGIPARKDLAFIADDPEQFASQVLVACTNYTVATTKVRNALDFIEMNYSPASAMKSLSEYIEEFRT